MAKLVDALASGASGSNPLEVRVLSRPLKNYYQASERNENEIFISDPPAGGADNTGLIPFI